MPSTHGCLRFTDTTLFSVTWFSFEFKPLLASIQVPNFLLWPVGERTSERTTREEEPRQTQIATCVWWVERHVSPGVVCKNWTMGSDGCAPAGSAMPMPPVAC